MTYVKQTPNQKAAKTIIRRGISPSVLARLLNCTEQHVIDLLDGTAVMSAAETAIMRLCGSIHRDRLTKILGDLTDNYEWRRIPGYQRYEASVHGQVRRASAGHGSMPGHVLRTKRSKEGHRYANIAPDDGPVRQLSIHRAVCLAFHGPAPSREMIVCHRNDIPDDNRPDNLYWGTTQDNADDRKRNWPVKLTHGLTQKHANASELTPRQIKEITKKTMLYRLARMAENA